MTTNTLSTYACAATLLGLAACAFEPGAEVYSDDTGWDGRAGMAGALSVDDDTGDGDHVDESADLLSMFDESAERHCIVSADADARCFSSVEDLRTEGFGVPDGEVMPVSSFSGCIFYEHRDYTGSSVVSYGSDIGFFGDYGFNDRVSSVYCRYHIAKLYQDISYSGGYWWDYRDKDLHPEGRGDIASSARVY